METCIKVAGDGIRLGIPLFPLKNSKDFLVMQYPINEIKEMDKDDIRKIVDELVAILENEEM